MDDFLKKFGKQVRAIREFKGYTQEYVAEKIGAATSTISDWENGKSFLEYPSLQKLCKALNVGEEDLFCFACSSDSKNNTLLDEIITLSRQLLPIQQKQIIEIIKTFIK